MRAPILSAALAVAGATNTTTTLPSLNISWYPCQLYSTPDANSSLVNVATGVAIDNPAAECADVSMPVCHPDVCESVNGTKTTISVFLKRMQAKAATSPKKALWVLQGGPGHTSEAMEGLMNDAYVAANGTLSVYTMDHRGVGRSTLLDCTTAETEAALATCLGKIKATYGSQAPAGFSVTSAATDLKRFVESSAFDNTNVFVYGVSYGTYLVERLMHLQPSTVKGYILDSIQSEQFYVKKDAPYYSNWDQDVGGIVDQFFTYCNRDDFCTSLLGPNSKKTLIALYEKLNKPRSTNQCAKILRQTAKQLGFANPSGVASQTMYEWLGSRDTRVFIPAYIYRLERCNHDDAVWLRNLQPPETIEAPEESGPYLNGTGYSDVVYHSIVFNEIWKSPSPTVEELYKQSVDSLITMGNLPASKASIAQYCVYKQNADPVCEGYMKLNVSFTYPRDSYWNKTAAVPRGASVLMFTGYLDPATPPKYAIDENATMAGTQKLLLEFPFTNHGIMSNTPLDDAPQVSCGTTILSSYLAANGDLTKVKSDCIDEVERLDFSQWSVEASNNLFGSQSPYEDTNVEAQVEAVAKELVKSYGAQVVVLSALLAAAAVALVGMVVYAAKLKSRAAAATTKEAAEAVVDNAVAADKENEVADEVVVTV